MSSQKIKNRRELFSQARKYLDIKSLFPELQYVGRAPLTDYQAKKISRELRALVESAGGIKHLERDFVKIRRTKGAREYLENTGMPKSSKGIILAGGEKINSGVTIKNGALFFNRGEQPSVSFPLDATTERTLEKSIRKRARYIDNADNNPYIATHGGKIHGASVDAELEGEEGDATDLLVDVATGIFNKYAGLAASGSKRKNGRLAAHPSKWGMALLIESK